MSAQYTPGPWRWELNEEHKSLHLVGGRPMFDLTIIQPVRWGMGSATLFIRDTAHDGMNIMHKLHERRDWIAPFSGRAHHQKWCADVVHPDMRLIAAAPDMFGILQTIAKLIDEGAPVAMILDENSPTLDAIRDVLAKVAGGQQ